LANFERLVRLYQRRLLRLKSQFSAFFEIYQIYSFAPLRAQRFSNFSSRICTFFTRKSQNKYWTCAFLPQFLLKLDQFFSFGISQIIQKILGDAENLKKIAEILENNWILVRFWLVG
jgi:hypothetical protein